LARSTSGFVGEHLTRKTKDNIMTKVGVYILVNRTRLFAAFALLAVTLAGGAGGAGALSKVSAQGSENWRIEEVQRAVRQEIINREGGSNRTVSFNSDARTEPGSNGEVRVRGTGAVSPNNDSRYPNARDNERGTRDFSYEALVNNRNRSRNGNGNVSGIRYEWRGGSSGDGRNDDRGGDGGYRGQSIYCASDDWKRHTCAINTNGAAVRLVNQKSGSACVEGRTWGFNRSGIWVDRGCRADFEVGGRDGGNGGRSQNNGAR
jgi:Protein of unknown function (DUF3011)